MAERTPPVSLLDGAALFLDFDGTLVELAETPAAIRVPPGLASLLRRLDARLKGRLAIISGRAIDDLERHLDCQGFAVSGSHGLELRLRGGVTLPLAVPAGLDEAKGEVRGFAASVPGLYVEEKPFGIAVHYRQSAENGGNVQAVLAEIAGRHELVLQRGKMVAELRPRGSQKGDALKSFMREPEFAGARPVFVGDDMTDENAFEAAAHMGGAGILVGTTRPTHALWRLADVAAVSAWLDEAAGR